MINFTPEDRRTTAFKKIRTFLKESLEEAREKNDLVRPEDQTNFWRGRISVFKELCEEMDRVIELEEHDGYDIQDPEELVDG